MSPHATGVTFLSLGAISAVYRRARMRFCRVGAGQWSIADFRFWRYAFRRIKLTARRRRGRKGSHAIRSRTIQVERVICWSSRSLKINRGTCRGLVNGVSGIYAGFYYVVLNLQSGGARSHWVPLEMGAAIRQTRWRERRGIRQRQSLRGSVMHST